MPEFATAAAPYTLRAADEDDLPGLARLYAEIEPDDDISAEDYCRTWRWLHRANPWAASPAFVGADTSGAIVGHVAMVPFRFAAGTREFTAGFPCQLMVAERLRHSLLYPNLVKRLLTSYPSAGIAGAYALITRPRVLQANLALGFRPIGRVAVYARPYRLSRVLAQRWPAVGPLATPADALLRLARRRRGGPPVERFHRFGPEWGPLLAEARTWYDFAAVKTPEILNWRFASTPHRGYLGLAVRDQGRLAGYAVLRRMPMKGLRVLALVDLLVDPRRPDLAQALLDRTHRLAIASDVDLSASLLPAHDSLAAVLRRNGFLPTPEQFTLVAHEPRRSEPRLLGSTLEQWHVTWFDHDFV